MFYIKTFQDILHVKIFCIEIKQREKKTTRKKGLKQMLLVQFIITYFRILYLITVFNYFKNNYVEKMKNVTFTRKITREDFIVERSCYMHSYLKKRNARIRIKK